MFSESCEYLQVKTIPLCLKKDNWYIRVQLIAAHNMLMSHFSINSPTSNAFFDICEFIEKWHISILCSAISCNFERIPYATGCSTVHFDLSHDSFSFNSFYVIAYVICLQSQSCSKENLKVMWQTTTKSYNQSICILNHLSHFSMNSVNFALHNPIYVNQYSCRPKLRDTKTIYLFTAVQIDPI